MPLTFVVEHLNRKLSELHPASSLKDHARFVYDSGAVSAVLGSLRLTPVHFPALDPETGNIVATDTALQVANVRGDIKGADFLYVLAWDAADVIFLDRFIRTLHALHHINVSACPPQHEPLILDVHVRHLAAVPSAHGQVFEQLLAMLGLQPAQIMFRIDAEFARREPEVQRAVRNFLDCGYRVVLADRSEVAAAWSEPTRPAVQIGR